MKSFKIMFPLNGVETELLVESMDANDMRYSVMRNVNDPHPLLLELCDHTWKCKSQDHWSLDDEQIHLLGQKISDELNKAEPFSSGVNAL
ncbi:hypothetical protein FW774_09835 [Pedobacter sp. BS3]|uniref:hypothetical protein n=1 Tax=Pedobacter sp. BS3 TaxID=2567937 RepID=UPI0011EF7FB4|nr:hypothetical protein [Pedobacter sp. BS3]TZF83759.1 hypothetical protein FW774_09835 [Pedobacter sp. BS3]